MADYDSPWKEALDLYFPAFLAFFFPHIHADIDWARGYEALDKELQQVAPQAAQGRRYVDKLFRVWRQNGREAWVLIHIEVQVRRERGFPRRMFVYNTRLSDKYNRQVVSLAVLADDDADWRPSSYEQGLWGCRARLDFLAVKLLDYAAREAELEADRNPFAQVVLAHLKALETRSDPDARRAWKFRLVRGLYERGFSAEDVRQLFRLIDWLLELPPVPDRQFWQEMRAYQEERIMPFLTTPERYGRLAGLLLAIENLLRIRFGDEGLALRPQLNEVYDMDKLLGIHELIATGGTLDQVRRVCRAAAEPTPPPKPKTRRGKRKDV
jgi:hypothetical protein